MSNAPLDGRVAVVTGGAGGIGRAICTSLAAAGASVIVGYHRSQSPAEHLAASLVRGGGQQHAALPVPVTDAHGMQALAQMLQERWERCDILVNCAGTTRFVAHPDLAALDDDLIDNILGTNVRGPFAAVRALRELLSANRGGLVVNISSIAAQIAMGSNIMYCASKAALDNMTRSLARALAPEIRVISVSPGLVKTDFIDGLDEDWLADQQAKTPLGRLAEPGDIGRAVAALAADFPLMTGTVVTIDGGRSIV